MSEQNPTTGDSIPDKIVSTTQAATSKMNEAALKAADAVDRVDTETIGKHARTLADRAQLFVLDNKLEIGAVVVFTAGFWAGRRVLARGFLRHLANERSEYLELAVTEKQAKKLFKNAGKGLGLIFNTDEGDFILTAVPPES